MNEAVGALQNTRTGGQLIVDSLRAHGVDTVFCVPGESYLGTLDAFHDVKDALRLVVCRQEGGAAYMAAAYGKLTGKPGICFVTRGPGGTNASVGIHTADQDASPVVLFIGQVPRDSLERKAFQEVDFRRMYGQLAKWVGQIDDPARVPEYVAHAMQLAVAGRPGPVVLAIPEDMQTEPAAAEPCRASPAPRAAPAPADLEETARRLAAAERPAVLVGGSGWTPKACADLARFAAAHALPVAAGFRRQDLIDNRHPSYVGAATLAMTPQVAEAIGEADLLIVLSQQLTDIVTADYTLVRPPRPRQALIQVAQDGGELGRVFHPDLAIVATMEEMCAALAGLAPPADIAKRRARTEGLHARYLESLAAPAPARGVDLGRAMAHLSEVLPEDAILANGAGNFSNWVHRCFVYKTYPSQLAPISGSMGYGLPAGIAAKLACPERQVVAVCGDGDFLMNGQELATAVAERLDMVILVSNNGRYGTIRAHQERHYPGRISGTELVNPDFAAYAKAFGAHGEIVERTEDFAAAFARAQDAGGPALLDLRVDPDQLSPTSTVESLRAAKR